ncbi:hypothetical protein PLICBS_008693 [Purpureocillium lilacinum]|uniref:uncharacterized protein n=1 Tax=Purpureocillium lilacinum TaxID=33203 RepID=UPI00207F05FB|nr:hypothetical protein PLICBS_008693 [Purpureocillium lilacinum]
MSILGWVQGQWSTLPYPDEDCSGRTIIITGGNSGLGLEAARHFVRLNAAKVVLACRSVERGEAARRDIEASQKRDGVVEVWQLDLGSFESVKDFAARASSQLGRLDVLLNSASILVHDFAIVEGHETMMTVNIISTFLLTVLLFPLLRQTAVRHNVTPHAFFPERKADHIFNTLKLNKNFLERYNTTKLLQLLLMRKLAAAADARSGKGQGHHHHVIVNALNPGLCRTQLFRRSFWPLSWGVWLAFAVFGREPEMGSRTLLAAACSGEDMHGRWMTDCRLQVWPGLMRGEEGERLADKAWAELGEILEGIEPGVMGNV